MEGEGRRAGNAPLSEGGGRGFGQGGASNTRLQPTRVPLRSTRAAEAVVIGFSKINVRLWLRKMPKNRSFPMIKSGHY